jgi:hypothetical protein
MGLSSFGVTAEVGVAGCEVRREEAAELRGPEGAAFFELFRFAISSLNLGADRSARGPVGGCILESDAGPVGVVVGGVVVISAATTAAASALRRSLSFSLERP